MRDRHARNGPRTSVDHSNGQRMIEHMGVHIVFDSTISRNLEVCGLCLRPAPMCLIYLKKGRGASKGYSVGINRSTCINLIRFKYASAGTSTESAPCTNIPVHCPICGPKQPAVWRYSLERLIFVCGIAWPLPIFLSEYNYPHPKLKD
jgi:hypothetical protein